MPHNKNNNKQESKQPNKHQNTLFARAASAARRRAVRFSLTRRVTAGALH
jgi:hypothetical protein